MREPLPRLRFSGLGSWLPLRYKRVFCSDLVRPARRPPPAAKASVPIRPHRSGSHLRPVESSPAPVVLPSAEAIAREEMLFAGLGLALKTAGLLLALITLTKLAVAHQQRLARHGEIRAVLQLQLDRLASQKRELDRLFSRDGHQALFQREEQWIAPNRRRIIWLPAESKPPTQP